jgi:hypothetical protein
LTSEPKCQRERRRPPPPAPRRSPPGAQRHDLCSSNRSRLTARCPWVASRLRPQLVPGPARTRHG